MNQLRFPDLPSIPKRFDPIKGPAIVDGFDIYVSPIIYPSSPFVPSSGSSKQDGGSQQDGGDTGGDPITPAPTTIIKPVVPEQVETENDETATEDITPSPSTKKKPPVPPAAKKTEPTLLEKTHPTQSKIIKAVDKLFRRRQRRRHHREIRRLTR